MFHRIVWSRKSLIAKIIKSNLAFWRVILRKGSHYWLLAQVSQCKCRAAQSMLTIALNTPRKAKVKYCVTDNQLLSQNSTKYLLVKYTWKYYFNIILLINNWSVLILSILMLIVRYFNHSILYFILLFVLNYVLLHKWLAFKI